MKPLIFLRYFKVFCKRWELCKLVCCRKNFLDETIIVFSSVTVQCTLYIHTVSIVQCMNWTSLGHIHVYTSLRTCFTLANRLFITVMRGTELYMYSCVYIMQCMNWTRWVIYTCTRVSHMHTVCSVWGIHCAILNEMGHTHVYTHTGHMALVGYLIVFSIVLFLKNSLVGYYCSYCNSLVGSIVLLL